MRRQFVAAGTVWGLISSTTAFLFQIHSSPPPSRSQQYGGMELGVKRKQKIKRWGNDNGASASASGFGSNPTGNSRPVKNTPAVDKGVLQNRKGEQPAAQQPTTTTATNRSSSPPGIQPLITAAEYARLNTLATKQRHALDESKRFVSEYLEQQLPVTSNRQLVQISENPLLFVIDDFIDPQLCRAVDNQANGCFHLLFPETLSDQLFQGQASELDGLLFNAASSRDHSDSPHLYYPDGLHMDTNNQCLFRHVTCILYLNDVPEECGGGTVFPVARALSSDPALQAAQNLLDHSMSHTKSRELKSLGLEEDAQLLERRIQTNCVLHPNTDTAIRVQPKAGRLLVFFSRDDQGRPDPRTWHAGERLRPSPAANGSGTEKRILTLFKEVDYEDPREPQVACTLEAFLAPQIAAQQHWLKTKARLQRKLLSRILGGDDRNV